MKKQKKPQFDKFDRGFRIRAYYGKGKDKMDAWIEVRKNGRFYKLGKYPAYRIWNLAAHFSEIVDSELTSP